MSEPLTALEWTRRWLASELEGPPDWSIEGPNRPRALDRSEVLIRRPSAFPAGGQTRDEIERRRTVAARLLRDVDVQLAQLAERRRALVHRVEACTVAMTGTGVLTSPSDDRPPQRLPWHRADHFDDPLPTSPRRAQRRSGRALRDATRDLLLALGRPADLHELERLLRLRGFTVPGRASQTLSNALRPAVADGSVVRVGRGRFAAVAPGTIPLP